MRKSTLRSVWPFFQLEVSTAGQIARKIRSGVTANTNLRTHRPFASQLSKTALPEKRKYLVATLIRFLPNRSNRMLVPRVLLGVNPGYNIRIEQAVPHVEINWHDG